MNFLIKHIDGGINFNHSLEVGRYFKEKKSNRTMKMLIENQKRIKKLFTERDKIMVKIKETEDNLNYLKVSKRRTEIEIRELTGKG